MREKVLTWKIFKNMVVNKLRSVIPVSFSSGLTNLIVVFCDKG